MKKPIIVFILFQLILLISSVRVFASSSYLNITSIKYLSTTEEYEKDMTNSEGFSGFVGDEFRIYYETDDYQNVDVSSNYNISVEDHYRSEEENYVDISLINSGETNLVIQLVDVLTGGPITHDLLAIVVYDEVNSLNLTTVYPSTFLGQKMVIDVQINNHNDLFLDGLVFYYLNNEGRRIVLLEKLTINNQLVIPIDELIAQNKNLEIFAQYDDIDDDKDVISNGLSISIDEVSYLTYFDVVNTSLKYCINDEFGSIYIRIPLDTVPNFIILDRSGAVSLSGYEIIQTLDTFALLELKLNLNTICQDETILLGGLIDSDNNYLYQRLNLTIIEEVNRIAITTSKEELENGEIGRFSIAINDIENVSCPAVWSINGVEVYTGTLLQYQFYDSGYQHISVEYQGYTIDTRVYVRPSMRATITWYIVLGILVVLVIPTMVIRAQRRRNKIANLKKDLSQFANTIKNLSPKTSNRLIHQYSTTMQSIKLRCVDLSEEMDISLLDNAILEMEKIKLLLDSLINIEEDRFAGILEFIDKRVENTLEILEISEKYDQKVRSARGKNDD